MCGLTTIPYTAGSKLEKGTRKRSAYRSNTTDIDGALRKTVQRASFELLNGGSDKWLCGVRRTIIPGMADLTRLGFRSIIEERTSSANYLGFLN